MLGSLYSPLAERAQAVLACRRLSDRHAGHDAKWITLARLPAISADCRFSSMLGLILDFLIG
jgi:hypothetical protein